MIKYLFSFDKKKFLWLFSIFLILTLGIWARAHDLSWHFSTFDDTSVANILINSEFMNKSKLFAVSFQSTYSPFQFIFTSFLISKELSYRALLFWGRLPSCIFGSLGLIAFILFYRNFKSKYSFHIFFGLIVLAFSLENIIYAKQMSNYAIGVFGLLLIMLMFIKQFEIPTLTIKYAFVQSLFLGILCTMQYSLLFFIPAFYLLSFIYWFKRSENKLILLGKYLFHGIIYLCVIFPMWFIFLYKSALSGITAWNGGENNEFVFQIPQDINILEKIKYAFSFFFENFLLIFQSITTFTSESHLLFKTINYLFLTLFILGMISFFLSKRKEKRYLGGFFLTSTIVWIVLVIINKLALSPTRHSLLLLPLFAITISEGSGFLSKLSKRLNIKHLPFLYKTLTTSVIFALIFSFCMNYSSFFKKRRDAFEEAKIMKVLETFNVDSILTLNFTPQPVIMKSVREYFDYWPPYVLPDTLFSKENSTYKRLAWISQRVKLNPTNFNFARLIVNRNIVEKQIPRPFLTKSFSDYRVLFVEEISSDVEIEFSNLTKNGSNSLFLYVLDLK